MTLKVNTLYGTFDEEQLKDLKGNIEEIVICMTKIQALNESISDINNLRLDAGIAQLKDDPRLVVIDREGNVIDPLIGLEKFAELLIEECIDRITTYDLVPGHSAKWEDIYDIHARLLQDLGEDLKEHFGVQE